MFHLYEIDVMTQAKEIIDREKAEEFLQIVSFFCYKSIGHILLVSSFLPTILFESTKVSIDRLIIFVFLIYLQDER